MYSNWGCCLQTNVGELWFEESWANSHDYDQTLLCCVLKKWSYHNYYPVGRFGFCFFLLLLPAPPPTHPPPPPPHTIMHTHTHNHAHCPLLNSESSSRGMQVCSLFPTDRLSVRPSVFCNRLMASHCAGWGSQRGQDGGTGLTDDCPIAVDLFLFTVYTAAHSIVVELLHSGLNDIIKMLSCILDYVFLLCMLFMLFMILHYFFFMLIIFFSFCVYPCWNHCMHQYTTANAFLAFTYFQFYH